MVGSDWWVITWQCPGLVNPTQQVRSNVKHYLTQACEVVFAQGTTLYCFRNAVRKQLASKHHCFEGWVNVWPGRWLYECLSFWLGPRGDHICMKQEQASSNHITIMPFWFPDWTTADEGSLGQSHGCLADWSNNVSNVPPRPPIRSTSFPRRSWVMFPFFIIIDSVSNIIWQTHTHSQKHSCLNVHH